MLSSQKCNVTNHGFALIDLYSTCYIDAASSSGWVWQSGKRKVELVLAMSRCTCLVDKRAVNCVTLVLINEVVDKCPGVCYKLNHVHEPWSANILFVLVH